jgi:hypothetical protein
MQLSGPGKVGWEDIQARKYSSFGRCIYCGSDGGGEGLRDEHLVPYSLGGHAALKQASCRACEAVTSRVELYIARHIFYQLRSHVGAPSRRKLPELSAFVSVGNKASVVNFEAGDHPFALMLPVWDWPGILRQVQPSSDFSSVNVRAYNFVPANLRETLGLPEGAPDPIIHVGPGTIDNVVFMPFVG